MLNAVGIFPPCIILDGLKMNSVVWNLLFY